VLRHLLSAGRNTHLLFIAVGCEFWREFAIEGFSLADEYPRSLQNAECGDLILEIHPPSQQKNAEGKEKEQHIKLCSLSKL
jgi:hypothetical protein